MYNYSILTHCSLDNKKSKKMISIKNEDFMKMFCRDLTKHATNCEIQEMLPTKQRINQITNNNFVIYAKKNLMKNLMKKNCKIQHYRGKYSCTTHSSYNLRFKIIKNFQWYYIMDQTMITISP